MGTVLQLPEAHDFAVLASLAAIWGFTFSISFQRSRLVVENFCKKEKKLMEKRLL